MNTKADDSSAISSAVSTSADEVLGALQDLEDLGNGVSRGWLDDHQIGVIFVPNTTRAAVDAWFNETARISNMRAHEPSLRLLFNFDYYAVDPSPYLRSRVAEANRLVPNTTKYIALVVQPTVLARVAQFMVRATETKSSVTRIFFTRKSGLEWLRRLKSEGKTER